MERRIARIAQHQTRGRRRVCPPAPRKAVL